MYGVSNLDDQANMTFPLGPLNKTSGLVMNALQVPSQTWNFSRNLTEGNFTWVDLPESPGRPSLAALWTVPVITRNGIYGQETMQLPCTVDARWLPIGASFDPVDSKALAVDIDISRQDSCLNLGKSRVSNRQSGQLRIERSWAAALDAQGPKIEQLEDITLMKQLFFRFIRASKIVPNGLTYVPYRSEIYLQDLDSAKILTSRMLSGILSAVIANGLASVSNNEAPAFVEGNTHLTIAGLEDERITLPPDMRDPRKWTEISFNVHRFGYGYAWKQSSTVQFGVSMLLIYLTLTTFFVIYLLHRILIQQQ